MIEALLNFGRKTPLRNIYLWLRMIYRELRAPHRNYIFRKTMDKVLEDPQCLLDEEILKKLSYVWGNQKYSANIDYLKDCIAYTAQSNLPVLECGSGLTTLLAGIIAQKSGNTIWTLEHGYFWYNKVQGYLKKYNINSVKMLLCAPLDYKSFSWMESVRQLRCPPLDKGDFLWYDAPFDSMPDKFSLVICDGHPGMNMAGQYCVFPIMKDRFMPGCVVLFDNSTRKHEEGYISCWAGELNMSYEIRSSRTPYYVLTQK